MFTASPRPFTAFTGLFTVFTSLFTVGCGRLVGVCEAGQETPVDRGERGRRLGAVHPRSTGFNLRVLCFGTCVRCLADQRGEQAVDTNVHGVVGRAGG